MRRRTIGVVAGILLMLAAAVPVAAADRVVESGTFYQFTLGTFSCDQNSCRDRFVDVFSIDRGLVAVCYVERTFNARTGRVTSDTNGCTEISDSVLSVSEDFDVSLAATDIQLFSCTQRRCNETDLVTVSASASGSSEPTVASGRVTVNEGSCKSRITFTDTSGQVSGSVTVDGSSFAGDGFAVASDQTVATTCR